MWGSRGCRWINFYDKDVEYDKSFFEWEEAWPFLMSLHPEANLHMLETARREVSLLLYPDQWDEKDLMRFLDRGADAFTMATFYGGKLPIAVQERIGLKYPCRLPGLSLDWYRNKILQPGPLHFYTPMFVSFNGLTEDRDIVLRLVTEGMCSPQMTDQMSTPFLCEMAQDPDPVMRDFAIGVLDRRGVLSLFELD